MTCAKTFRAHSERGIAAVEFAIVLPLLLLMMLATAELGRAFYQYDTLTKAVRDGARYIAGVAYSGTTGTISLTASDIQITRNLVVYGNIAGGNTPLLPGLSASDVSVSAVDAIHVQVAAAYPYSPIFASLPTFGLGPADLSTTFTLTADVTMRAL